ncbi:hypothetical protein NJB85_01990 [Myroides odoratimimus]|uniref:hypothetical protein n=1 Tax=Myroides odoratimimus TaxID=76832 RepID=UPI002097D350|nr:hypothetical protein [Myroides odoratimimus]MCO7721947.1 hypothetical protein [Myroides odoratimimus]
MKRLIFIFTISTILLSCKENNSAELEELRIENETLKKEIEDLKHGAEALLFSSTNFIQDKEYIQASIDLKILLDKYPSSKEAIKAKELLAKVEKEIEAQKIADEKAKKEKLANATKNMRSNHDDIREITWYRDKTTPRYTNRNNLHLYFGKTPQDAFILRFVIQYTADDWLFIDRYTIKTDNNTYNINTEYGEVKKDNNSGSIWEWYDTQMTSTLYDIVKDIISSKSVKLRCSGSQYYKDRTITEAEKKALQNVLDAYEALGGNTTFY